MSVPIGAAAWRAAVDEQMGDLIVILDGLSDDVLERVIDAAQFLDQHAQEEFERRRTAPKLAAVPAAAPEEEGSAK